MQQQTVQIMKESWDHLVILDACRADSFAQVWNRFFPQGRFRCVWSVGTDTVEWRDRSFPEAYPDVVYVSANPYINSRKPVLGFFGADHFHRVIDVWATGWDVPAGTVRPETVTRAVLEARTAYPDKRLIVHYIQPHAPYLGLDQQTPGFPLPDVERETVLLGVQGGDEDAAWKRKWFRRLLPLCRPVIPEPAHWYVGQWLRMSPRSPMDAVRRSRGKRGLRAAYQDNLERVLVEVVRLVGSLSGRVVITADHGERLGEWGSYSHRGRSSSPYLRSVPWLEVDGQGRPNSVKHPGDDETRDNPGNPMSAEEQRQVEERLRALGYVE